MTAVIASFALVFAKLVFGWIGVSCLFAAYRYKKVAFVWLGLGFLLLLTIDVKFAAEWQRLESVLRLLNIGFLVLFLLAYRFDKDKVNISVRRIMLFR
jgi:hypothetical protein